MTKQEQRNAEKFEKILVSMAVDVAYINQQLAIYEKQFINHIVDDAEEFRNIEEYTDIVRRVRKVLLEVASLT